jgi:predicted small metal-binding protein
MTSAQRLSRALRIGHLNARRNQEELEMHEHEPDNPKWSYIACGQVVPECTFTASAATEEELMQKVAVHAAREHGVDAITPELAERIRAAIKRW